MNPFMISLIVCGLTIVFGLIAAHLIFRKSAFDPTVCDCEQCKEVGSYNRHIRVSPTLIINVQYFCSSPTGDLNMGVEMDSTIIPKIRRLFSKGNWG